MLSLKNVFSFSFFPLLKYKSSGTLFPKSVNTKFSTAVNKIQNFNTKVTTVKLFSEPVFTNRFFLNLLVSQTLVKCLNAFSVLKKIDLSSCSPSRRPQAGPVWRWRATGSPRGTWSRLWTPATSSPPRSSSTCATLPEWCLRGRKTVSQRDPLAHRGPLPINGFIHKRPDGSCATAISGTLEQAALGPN